MFSSLSKSKQKKKQQNCLKSQKSQTHYTSSVSKRFTFNNKIRLGMDDSGGLKIPIIERYIKYYGGIIYDEDIIIPCPEGSQMRSDWSSLPLLALKQVLRYLNRADALSCMSTCRHWRTAMLMYEDQKTTLKVRVNDLERSLFVSRIFRKQTKRLIVLVNSCDSVHMARFMNTVMTLFYDVKLQELVFVGNCYLHQNKLASIPEIPRTAVERLVLRMRTLKRLGLMGCKISSANNRKLGIKDKENIRGTESIRLRVYNNDPSPCDSVLSKCNTDIMVYSNLQAMILDYELINTESLETLSQLKMFRHLTMLIRDKPSFSLKPIDWLRLQASYANPLNVTVCLIQLQSDKIQEVMDNVFVQGLELVALKALYCKTMYMDAIVQVVNMYNKSLQEFVWADCPYDSTDHSLRSLRNVRLPELNMCSVNPLILMCWQCERLRRVVVHGYWIWQYDVVGMMRLRHSLRHLELSSVSSTGSRALRLGDGISRVMKGDPPQRVGPDFLEQISEFKGMSGWTPVPHGLLHAGLRAAAPQRDRAAYVLLETRTPLGVTYPYPHWRQHYYEQLVIPKTHSYD